ncbi:MAG TPA: hypothetical protein RMH99_18590 [Sandaracinaceae bacterium LLY-WYZ-13_1]|nr:hypothetical protein [Sandaracinaceae bacterium LLY-WYZ-13_1]
MGYRDEREALRQRVAELETELAEAKGELGDRPGGAVPAHPLLGGPTRIVHERALPTALDEETVARLVAALRRELGEVGRLERVGRSVAWSTSGRSGRLVELTLEPDGDGTRLRLVEPLRGLAGGLFGGVLGGVGGGGVMIPMIPLFFQEPLWLLGTLPAWLGGVYYGTRALYARVTRQRHEELGRLARRLAALAESPAGVRARVAVDEDAEAPAPVEVDARGRGARER